MGKLARPRWRVGQVLQPRHLRALEDAAALEAAARARAPGLPEYGIFAIDWTAKEPKGGELYVNGLSAIFREGTVVDVPGNARVRGPLKLTTTGRSAFDVYLHVVDPPEDDEAKGNPLAEPAPEIERREHVLELSPDVSILGSRDRILLGHFELGAEGPRLAEDVWPPLLRVEAAAGLVGRLRDTHRTLHRLDKRLDELAADALAQGGSLASLHRVRIASRKLDALLADRNKGLPLHPYWVYAALRDFSFELAALDERKPLGKLPVYDHDQLFASFNAVLRDIDERVNWSPPGSPRVPFELVDGRMVATLPDDARGAPEVYVVVLKHHETDEVPFEKARLASGNRLTRVREYALRGVPFKKEPAPKFRSSFGGAAEFYRVSTAAGRDQEPSEWDHVIAERTIAFYPLPQLDAARFVLCWSRP